VYISTYIARFALTIHIRLVVKKLICRRQNYVYIARLVFVNIYNAQYTVICNLSYNAK